jgi:hypothetical protein
MHKARIPPVDPAPATITAVLAMHAGHIFPSSERTPCANISAGVGRPGSDKCGGIPDAIATSCIEKGLTLLYSDKDFDPFVQHLGLRTALPGT